MALLDKCSTVREVLRTQHRSCRRYRKAVECKPLASTPRPIEHLRTAGVTCEELQLCHRIYPNVRLARLDRRTRAVRSLLVRSQSPTVTGGAATTCLQCASCNVRVDDTTADVVCRSCGWCTRVVCARWHGASECMSDRCEKECDRVFELFYHVCDRFRLGAMCRERACLFYRKCRVHLAHLEQPEYVECACLILAARSRPPMHKLHHAQQTRSEIRRG